MLKTPTGDELDPAYKCPRYKIKQSYNEVPAILKLLVMQTILSSQPLPGPLSPGVAAPDSPISGSNRIVWH